MDTNLFIVIIQAISIIIALFTALVLYWTIRSNNILNQNNLFNELVRQERELRVKLDEYKTQFRSFDEEDEEFDNLAIEYDTLLFNYYEYLGVCINQRLVNEKKVKYYFKNLLISVKEHFYEISILFNEGYALRKDYPALRWLFKKWDIEY